jgi:hypothetical protein
LNDLLPCPVHETDFGLAAADVFERFTCMKQTVELTSPPPSPLPKTGGFLWLKEVDRLLRGDSTRLSVLREGGLQTSTDRLQVAIVLLGMVYGLCMGIYALLRGDSASLLQFISGMVKVPALFLLTLLVTFPSLYVFNALVGSRLNPGALWRLLTSSVALNMAILASFGPIVAFFSLSTTSYSFMLLLNVLVFAAAGGLGLKFLLRTLHRLSLNQPDGTPPFITEGQDSVGPLDNPSRSAPARQVTMLFRCWIVVFGLVGSQMAWVLRPFLGCPDQPFSFFRARESNFFEAVWHHIAHLFGG